jgi:hypothetical protein
MAPRGSSAAAHSDRSHRKNLRELPENQYTRLMRIRDEIQRGTYETKAKWGIALGRVIDALRG